MGWVPPKWWSAWPLRPEDVPRDGEVVGKEDVDNAWVWKRLDEGEMSREVEECLMAVTVREARRRFEEREEDVQEGEAEDASDENIGDHERDVEEPMIKTPSESLEPKSYLRPVVSADDARSADLLRPSIRHTLSKLDAILLSLHHSRESCHRKPTSSTPDTDDESIFSESPTKLPRGRPRKLGNLTLLQKDGEALTFAPTDLFRAKKTHIGRPQKAYPRIAGESQEDYLIRIARIQKKSLPSFAAPAAMPPPRLPSVASEKSRKSPARRATNEELKVSRRKKLGLRDWSEVLGSAALVGFEPDFVARVARRCANLFGEGMTMWTMNEAPLKEKRVDFETTYVPEEIPDFRDDYEISEDDELEEVAASGKRKAATELYDDAWYCPFEVCRRRNMAGFEFRSELRRHMVKIHKLEGDEIDELLNDEVMDGAVHNDGFLEPLRYRRGVRGADKAPRKRSRKASVSTDASEVKYRVSEMDEEESASSETSDEGDDRDIEKDYSTSS